MRDFDRPLAPRGLRDAAAIGERLAAAGLLPERVICSTGLRARQTLETAQGHLPAIAVEWTETLYSTDAAGYLNVIRQAGAASSVMLVGHNPMMEETALNLVAPDDEGGQALRRSGFPTAGLAIFQFDGPLDQISAGSCRMVDFLKPEGK